MIDPKIVQKMRESAGLIPVTNGGLSQDPSKLFGEDLVNYYKSLDTPEKRPVFDPIGAVKTGVKGAASVVDRVAAAPGHLMDSYKGAIDRAKSAVQGGAEDISKGAGQLQFGMGGAGTKGGGIKDVAKGVGNIALGTAEAGLGGIGAGLQAIFAPVAETARVATPKFGSFLVGDFDAGQFIDSNLEAAFTGIELGGPAGVIPGMVINSVFQAVNYGESHLPAKAKAWLSEHPKILPLVNDALAAAMTVYGSKKLEGIGAEQGAPSVLDQPVGQALRTIGGNFGEAGAAFANNPVSDSVYKAGGKAVQRASELAHEGMDRLGSAVKRIRAGDSPSGDLIEMPDDMDASEMIADKALSDKVKYQVQKFAAKSPEELDALDQRITEMFAEARQSKRDPASTEDIARKLMRQKIEQVYEATEYGMEDAGRRMSEAMGLAAEEAVPQVPRILEDYAKAWQDRAGIVFEPTVDSQGAPIFDPVTGAQKFTAKPAPNRVIKVDPGDFRAAEQGYEDLMLLNSNPTAQRASDTISLLRSHVNYGQRTGVRVNDIAEGIFNETQHNLDMSVKPLVDAFGNGEDYSMAKTDYKAAISLRNELAARAGEGNRNAGSISKRIVNSVSDNGLKDLIWQAEDYTGLDITAEATLASEIMKMVGDTRADSLLENTREVANALKDPMSIPGRLVEKLGDKVVGAFTDPEQMLHDYINAARRATPRGAGGPPQGNISDAAAEISSGKPGGKAVVSELQKFFDANPDASADQGIEYLKGLTNEQKGGTIGGMKNSGPRVLKEDYIYKPTIGKEIVIPAGTEVEPASNLPDDNSSGIKYWVKDWEGMDERAQSIMRNEGFGVGEEHVSSADQGSMKNTRGSVYEGMDMSEVIERDSLAQTALDLMKNGMSEKQAAKELVKFHDVTPEVAEDLVAYSQDDAFSPSQLEYPNTDDNGVPRFNGEGEDGPKGNVTDKPILEAEQVRGTPSHKLANKLAETNDKLWDKIGVEYGSGPDLAKSLYGDTDGINRADFPTSEAYFDALHEARYSGPNWEKFVNGVKSLKLPKGTKWDATTYGILEDANLHAMNAAMEQIHGKPEGGYGSVNGGYKLIEEGFKTGPKPNMTQGVGKRDVQAVMDEFYDKWQENPGLTQAEALDRFADEQTRAAVSMGNLNYQVENGGFAQYKYNGYSKRHAEFLDDVRNEPGLAKKYPMLAKGLELEKAARTANSETIDTLTDKFSHAGFLRDLERYVKDLDEGPKVPAR